MKFSLKKPRPDINQFIGVIKGQIVQKKPLLAELYLDKEIIAAITEDILGRKWVEHSSDIETKKAYWDNITNVHYCMGYDYIRISGNLEFPSKPRLTEDAAEFFRKKRKWADEGTGLISSWEEFEKYPWPLLDKVDLWDYEYAASHVQEGMGVFVCPSNGFLELLMDPLLGYENLSMLLYDDPELVKAVFNKVGELIYGFYEKIIGLPNLVGFFQGDDMGYKTSTLLSPTSLREYVLPWHKKLAHLAHKNGLLYMLHSCGNLESIMEDLIEDVKIDAKHSYEDEAVSVTDFYKKYGKRIGILGGIDMDKLCRLPEDELRKYIRGILEICMANGRYALGSGNSVANYVPLKNYLIMLEEGSRW